MNHCGVDNNEPRWSNNFEPRWFNKRMYAMLQEKKIHRFSVGFPNDEYQWIKEKSQKETRSMAGTIVELVKKAKESEEAETHKP